MTQPIEPSPGNREHRLLAEEHAVLYAFDSESDAVAVWFREHLDSGCPTCRVELDRAERTVAALLQASTPVAAPPAVRDRLFARIQEEVTADPGLDAPQGEYDARVSKGLDPASAPSPNGTARPAPGAGGGVQVWKNWQSGSGRGLRTVRAGETEWEPTAVEGIYVRALHIDEATDSVTMLVRMDPGTTYPSHRHGGDEQCYVLEGDLHVGEIVLQSGDFQLAPEESEHGPQSTLGGCTLLIISSRNDELLPA